MKKKIVDAYDIVKPDDKAKKRMLKNIKAMASEQSLERKEEDMKKSNVKFISRAAVAAAVILMVPTVAYATNLLGLQEMKLGKEDVSLTTEDKDIADMISLQGLTDSPEQKACKEWYDFENQYDADGAVLAEVGNSIVGLGDYEENYGCYSQEMADKVDEICEKYQLKMLTGFELIGDDYKGFLGKTGVGDMLNSLTDHGANQFIDGWYYQDGTFHIEGTAMLSKPSLIMVDYQFGRYMKGTFNTVMLNVGNIEDYRQWEYTTSNGQKVLLANSNDKSLIMADREKSFVSINILNDTAVNVPEISDEMLEELAEVFDFSVIP